MAKNIFISNALPQEAVGLIPKDFTLDYNDTDTPLSKTELVSRLKGKDGLVCHIISKIDDEVLAAVPTLRVVANVAVGYNNIDVAAAKRRGVTVTNTPDVLTETTADFAWTLLMATARRVVEADHYARSGRWTAWKWDLLWGADVHGKTLGIVGFGRIGRAVARRALGFRMRVLYHDAVKADAAVERELSATATDSGWSPCCGARYLSHSALHGAGALDAAPQAVVVALAAGAGRARDHALAVGAAHPVGAVATQDVSAWRPDLLSPGQTRPQDRGIWVFREFQGPSSFARMGNIRRSEWCARSLQLLSNPAPDYFRTDGPTSRLHGPAR